MRDKMKKTAITQSEFEAIGLMGLMGDTTRDPHYERDYIIALAKRLVEEMGDRWVIVLIVAMDS